MINASRAHELYEENWDLEFTTMEALSERIELLSTNGAYELCVYIDSKNQYEEVFSVLKENGFEVEHYNGGDNNIIEVHW